MQTTKAMTDPTWDVVTVKSDPENNNNYILHSEDGPALIRYNKDYDVLYEAWYINGQKHRYGGGPAVIMYRDDGSVSDMEWYDHGKLHRYDGPAVISNGLYVYEHWYLFGEKHRVGGPAVIVYNNNGIHINMYWYLHGEKMSQEEYNNKL